MKERHRCEVMFIARIMHLVAITATRFDTEGELDAFKKMAFDAVMEPVSDLCAKDKERIRRRVTRMEKETLLPMCDKVKAEKAVLIGYYFIEDLQSRAYLCIPEGSSLRTVTDTLLGAIDPRDEVTQGYMEMAQEQARIWMERLQREGYFI